jgi:UPF0755 protein
MSLFGRQRPDNRERSPEERRRAMAEREARRARREGRAPRPNLTPPPAPEPEPAQPEYAEQGYDQRSYQEPYAEPGYEQAGYEDPGAYAEPAPPDQGYAEPAPPDQGYAEHGYAEQAYAAGEAYPEQPAGYAEQPPAEYADQGYVEPAPPEQGYAGHGHAEQAYGEEPYPEQGAGHAEHGYVPEDVPSPPAADPGVHQDAAQLEPAPAPGQETVEFDPWAEEHQAVEHAEPEPIPPQDVAVNGHHDDYNGHHDEVAVHEDQFAADPHAAAPYVDDSHLDELTKEHELEGYDHYAEPYTADHEPVEGHVADHTAEPYTADHEPGDVRPVDPAAAEPYTAGHEPVEPHPVDHAAAEPYTADHEPVPAVPPEPAEPTEATELVDPAASAEPPAEADDADVPAVSDHDVEPGAEDPGHPEPISHDPVVIPPRESASAAPRSLRGRAGGFGSRFRGRHAADDSRDFPAVPARAAHRRGGPPPGGSGGTGAGGKRPRRRRGRLILLGVAIVAALLLVWVGFSLFQPFKGEPSGNEVRVTIPAGSSVGQIGDLLAEKGVVDSAFWFEARATIGGDRGLLKPGKYTLAEGMSYSDAISALTEGPPPPKKAPTINVLLPEGLSRKQAAAEVKKQGVRGNYMKATEKSRFLNPQRYGAPAGATLEGFLYPATYELVKSRATVRELVKRQLRTFKENFAQVNMRRARKANLTAYDVITIASLIDDETAVAKERRLVASVIWNRLKMGEPLGIDATIRYATDNWDSPLKESELAIDSPYNTRLNVGLPPSPINSPNVESMQAAANPANTDYLFYVVKPWTCGEHAFAKTLAEHERNVAAYEEARQKNGGNAPTPDKC